MANNLTLVTGKPKFTPGPWRFTPPGPADSKGYGVCALWGEPGSVEQIANNYLISAAPDMYKLLEEVKNHISWQESDNVCKSGLVEDIDKLLAKARGEE